MEPSPAHGRRSPQADEGLLPARLRPRPPGGSPMPPTRSLSLPHCRLSAHTSLTPHLNRSESGSRASVAPADLGSVGGNPGAPACRSRLTHTCPSVLPSRNQCAHQATLCCPQAPSSSWWSRAEAATEQLRSRVRSFLGDVGPVASLTCTPPTARLKAGVLLVSWDEGPRWAVSGGLGTPRSPHCAPCWRGRARPPHSCPAPEPAALGGYVGLW